ncbi:CLUMA_CG007191, isoform A [Clunio marinus]|uniref:CLUMA_CG007191, isoform A n=1 Tax=Clunio marinus TaxID=568069 RepID=A0A1J1I473_9DIPT|nr:CLUMA_CG007191, isoform A [Clunio marinus]
MNSKKSSKSSQSNAGTSKPSQILQGVIGSKANSNYNRMQIWRQLNTPESSSDALKPNIFSLPEKLLKHSAKLTPHEKKKKKTIKIYDPRSGNDLTYGML